MTATVVDLGRPAPRAGRAAPRSRRLPALVRARPDRPLLLERVDTGLPPAPPAMRRHATWAWIFLLCSVVPWSFEQPGRITLIGKRPE